MMADFICLTSTNGTTFVININHIVGYYRLIGEDATIVETDSSFEDGLFLVNESVSHIFDKINLIKGGVITG